jgi:hypothetical protein
LFDATKWRNETITRRRYFLIEVLMKKWKKTSAILNHRTPWLVMLIFSLAHTTVFAGENLWVSASGRDNWPGSSQQPLATVQAALSRAPAGHIRIAPGTYYLPGTLVFDGRNAGAVLEGTGPGKTILSGAATIASFEQAGSSLWRGRANMPVSRVWIGGEPVPSSKAPARYWHYITEQTLNERDPVSQAPVDLSHRAFHPEPADMAILARLNAADLKCVVVTLWHSWEISKHHIARIDSKRNMIYLADDAPWAIHEFSDVQRYQLENVPGISDAAGTWYRTEENWIYYRATAGQDMSRTPVVGSGLPHVVEIHGTQDIVFRNIQFSFSGASVDPGSFKSNQAASVVDAAIVIDDSSGIRFERITISHTGGYGIWFRRNCRDSVIQESLIEDLGAGGVRIGETDTTPTPGHETSRIQVDNNIIRKGGRVYPSAVAVLIGHSGGNRITHNEIHDFYYTGISAGWKWDYGASPAVGNVIESNYIRRIGQGYLADMAGIYTLGESPGTTVRANVIYDITGYPGGAGAWGLYADQASSGINFENNLVLNTTSGGFHENFGKDNQVRGNVFAFGREGQVELSKAEAHRSLIFSGNAVLSDGVTFFRGDWEKAVAQIDKNIYFDISGRPPTWLGQSFGKWKQLGFDQSSVYGDPGFVDPLGGDFHLKSPAAWSWEGHSPIGIAGVYGAETWRTMASEGTQIATAPVPNPPNAAPIEIEDDFEGTAIGSGPSSATVVAERDGDGISVSDERAASGMHSLKFQDVQGEKFAYNPHFFYKPNHISGTTSVEFRLYIEQGYCFSTEWRDSDSPYHIGPSLTISGEQLRVGGNVITSIPDRTWITIKIDAQEGPTANREWHLEVSGQNGTQGRWTFVDPNDQWRRLEWLGFMSSCRSNAKLFIDDIKVKNR